MNKYFQSSLALCLATILLSTPVYAAMGHKAAAAHGGKQKAHHFTPHWSKTLSDQQKHDIDSMHLALNRQLVILKAEADLKQKELNVLTAQDHADQAAIKRKIAELMAIKTRIMQARYDHIVAMRGVLTPDQRISYDMNVLMRSGIK